MMKQKFKEIIDLKYEVWDKIAKIKEDEFNKNWENFIHWKADELRDLIMSEASKLYKKDLNQRIQIER